MDESGFEAWEDEFSKQEKAGRAYVPYLAHLGEYFHTGQGEWSEFRDRGCGWKAHLNVFPQNVERVSVFLKKTGIDHKFLSGGEIEEGKIFTLFLGSKATTEKAVRLIVDEVGSFLEEPVAEGELLFAPGVCGRFEGEKQYFSNKRYREGISVSRKFSGTREITEEMIEGSREELENRYGRYFGGGIEFYDPGQAESQKVVPQALKDFFDED